jgi:hypothetical protein
MSETMVTTLPRPLARRETLDERVARLEIEPRACRDCRAFTPDPGGLGFGWCNAHDQYVKLAQGSVPFFSQCQFKSLTRVSPTEEEGT